MAYKEGDEKKYFPRILTILALLAVVLSALVYMVVKEGLLGSEELIEVTENGVDPGDGLIPDGPPSVTPPVNPPPAQ